MGFNPGLQLGETIDNNKLREIFKCSPQGGMRRSLKTNSLVIVSDQIRSIYKDRKHDDGTFHYTGMGLQGDQDINATQNKTLAQSQTNGVSVFLFEVFKPKLYTFMGEVELAGNPYEETQPDLDGTPRSVWIFPLKTKSNCLMPLIEEEVVQPFQAEEKSARQLNLDDLQQKAARAARQPKTQNVISPTYVRDPYVSAYAKQRANGTCQLCNSPAPFTDKNGKPYLESHHIIWLSKAGEDSIENTVALCPNCHRKMHVLDRAKDKTKLLKIAKQV